LIEIEQIHDVGAPRNGASGHPAAEDLSKRRQIRLQFVDRLCASQRDAKTAQDFIEDEEGAYRMSGRLDPVQKRRGDRDHAKMCPDRLDDECRDLVPELFDRSLETLRIVRTNQERLCSHFGKDSWRRSAIELRDIT